MQRDCSLKSVNGDGAKVITESTFSIIMFEICPIWKTMLILISYLTF